MDRPTILGCLRFHTSLKNSVMASPQVSLRHPPEIVGNAPCQSIGKDAAARAGLLENARGNRPGNRRSCGLSAATRREQAYRRILVSEGDFEPKRTFLSPMYSPERNDGGLSNPSRIATDSSALPLHDRRSVAKGNELDPVAEVVPLARPVRGQAVGAIAPADSNMRGDMVLAPGGTDGMAVGSAICGLTGLIPLVSQIAGLGLGFAGLARIRRARRRGILVTGKGWAITGIVTSIFGLLGWIGLGLAMTAVSSSFGNTKHALSTVLEAVRAGQ